MTERTRMRSENAYIRQVNLRPVHIPTVWCQFGDGCVVGGVHTVEDWTKCAQTHTQTHKIENSISARFTPFTWWI